MKRNFLIVLIALGALFISAAAFAEPLTTTPNDGPQITTPLNDLQVQNPGMKINWRGDAVAMVTGLSVQAEGGTATLQAIDFLSQHGATFGLDVSSLQASPKVRGMRGRSAVSFTMYRDGLRVLNRHAVVTLTDAGVVKTLSSDLRAIDHVESGDLSKGAAEGVAIAAIYGDSLPVGAEVPTTAELVIVSDFGVAVVAWKVEVARLPTDRIEVLVDSRNGRVIKAHNRTLR